MSSRRKTMSIGQFVDEANHMILSTPEDMDRERYAIGAVVERVLHDSGQYAGFMYITAQGSAVPTQFVQADQYDDSRRHYHVKAR